VNRWLRISQLRKRRPCVRERERRKEDDHDAPICLPHANPCSRSINLRYAQQPEVTFRWSERARIPHCKCALLVCPHCTETSLIRSSVELSTKIFSPEKMLECFRRDLCAQTVLRFTNIPNLCNKISQINTV